MWNFYNPKFEYESLYPDFDRPWAGHKRFAYDLVRNTEPKVVVELGTEKGTSLFSFAQAAKDGALKTDIFAIDTWEGDEQAGYYGNEVYEEVVNIVDKFYKKQNIQLLRMTFDNALSKFKDKSVDILHIDGLHTYEAVSHDYETWKNKLTDNGIIMFHDIAVVKKDFGVKKHWSEICSMFPVSIAFKHSNGLGVLFKKDFCIEEINEKMFIVNYETAFEREVDKDLIYDTLRGVGELREEIQKRDLVIGDSEKAISDLGTELKLIKNSRIWKVRNLLRGGMPNVRKNIKSIAFIVPSTGVSGGLKVVLQHANNLAKMGHEVTLINVGIDQRISWYKGNKVKVVCYEPNKKLLQSMQFDVLFATFWSTTRFFDELNADRYVYFVQSDERRFYHDTDIIKDVEETYSGDYEFMTMAKWIQGWLFDEFGKQSYYVPNALNDEFFGRKRNVYESTGRKPRILIEGGIDIPYKGMDDAYGLVKDLDCELWIISNSGKPRHDWKYDKFFHNVPCNKMANIYQECDILLKLSRVESFSLPALEMMATGGSVVIQQVTGIEDFAKDGTNCLIVKNTIEAKHALDRVIHNLELRDVLSKNGIEEANRWNLDDQAKYLKKFLNNEISMPTKKEYIKYKYTQPTLTTFHSKESLAHEYNEITKRNNMLIERLVAIENSRFWKLRNMFVKFLRLKRKM